MKLGRSHHHIVRHYQSIELEQNSNQIASELQQYLGLYKRELLGWVLVGRLHLPMPVVGGLFVFLYFGVLVVLHALVGHPLPVNLGEVFSHPSTSFYYPNLIGIAYDLFGNPFLFVLLVTFRDYIPRQFVQLERDGLIQEKPSLSRLNRLIRYVARSLRVQFLVINLFPFVVSLLLAIVDIQVYQPVDTPAKYAIFLTLVGRYASLAIIAQLAYIFLIMSNYSLNVRLNLAHPDRCCGLAPFGNMAIAIYSALFVWAMIQAVGISIGGSAWQRAITTVSGPVALIYLWILFPLAILFIFGQLVYRPHRALLELQRKYLETSGQAWTNYHQNIQSSLMAAIKASQVSLANKSQYNYSDDLELLEAWAKLDKYVADMHTWPISNATLRLMAIFVNPFLPITIPAIAEFLVSKLP